MECDGQRIVCLCCEKYSQTFSLRHYADGKCIGGTAGGASGRCKTTSGTGDSYADPVKAGKTYGACCILYPKVLEQLAERVDGDYYLIPSSVHEFILLPVDQGRSAEELKEMIVEVNSTELTPGRDFVGSALFIQQAGALCKNTLILTGHV